MAHEPERDDQAQSPAPEHPDDDRGNEQRRVKDQARKETDHDLLALPERVLASGLQQQVDGLADQGLDR